MLYTRDKATITKFLQDRAALEQEIALGLSEFFKTGELHSKLNVAVWASFMFLSDLKKELALKQKIDVLEGKNDFLFGFVSPKTVEGVLAFMDEGKRLTAEQAGNLIRFYGEVVEACADMSVYWRKQRAKQIGWRYGGGGEAFKASRNSSYVAMADRGSVWQKTESSLSKVTWSVGKDGKYTKQDGGKTIVGGRVRVNNRSGEWSNHFAKGANPYYDLIPGNLFDNDTAKNLHIGKAGGGVMGWEITGKSTVGKIDRTFGLPYGADISGTTTDNLYFLTGWADVSKGDPLMMMLPLAAIVGEYHHSLLEVAAAMSLRKVIGYCIGMYSTLVPALPQDAKPFEQRTAITNLMKSKEDDVRNVHILVHYLNNQIAGAFIMEPSDMAGFKKLATIDIRLWPKFGKMPQFPSEEEIMKLLGEVGLVDSALMSRRGALRNSSQQATMERQRLARHGL
jgi:hypothetical protein